MLSPSLIRSGQKTISKRIQNTAAFAGGFRLRQDYAGQDGGPWGAKTTRLRRIDVTRYMAQGKDTEVRSRRRTLPPGSTAAAEASVAMRRDFPLDNAIICDSLYDIMKVVLDTNILVAGLYSKNGASYNLLKAALSGELSFALSPLMALEYEGILNEKIGEGFLSISKEDCSRILSTLFAYLKNSEKK